MIEVHTHASRLAYIERTLVECGGMLGLMQDDGSIPLHWQSQVAEKRVMLRMAILEVIKENGETNNDEVEQVPDMDSNAIPHNAISHQ